MIGHNWNNFHESFIATTKWLVWRMLKRRMQSAHWLLMY
uniref:Uncharacterized protein n=1 Tax=Syphacia muris TaxID=451379 RepID=A0A0N5AKP5_9BILA